MKTIQFTYEVEAGRTTHYKSKPMTVKFPQQGDGDTTFSFAAGSCTRSGSQSPVFESIMAHKPNLFVQLGDIHYSGDDDLNQEHFEFGLHEVLAKNKKQAAFYERQALTYIFDDHDFGSNNAN